MTEFEYVLLVGPLKDKTYMLVMLRGRAPEYALKRFYKNNLDAVRDAEAIQRIFGAKFLYLAD